MYFILRKVLKQGHYENIILGDSYEVVYNPSDLENERTFGCVHCDAFRVTLCHEYSYYIMTSNGDTFEKIKMG